jgi:hypothetical protein
MLFLDLLMTSIPLTIPEKTPLEHHWIVAPPGAGNAMTLQYFIAGDLAPHDR